MLSHAASDLIPLDRTAKGSDIFHTSQHGTGLGEGDHWKYRGGGGNNNLFPEHLVLPIEPPDFGQSDLIDRCND